MQSTMTTENTMFDNSMFVRNLEPFHHAVSTTNEEKSTMMVDQAERCGQEQQHSSSSVGSHLTFSNLPNLPGFSKYTSIDKVRTHKSQSLNFKNGYMVVMENKPAAVVLPTRTRPIASNLEKKSTAANGLSEVTPPHDKPVINFPSYLPQEVTHPNDTSGRYSLFRQRKNRESNRIILPFCPGSQLPSFLEHDRRVLMFNAYFEENVMQSAIENKRVMKCDIYFYIEDGTIEIIQKKQENSGIPQGVFLRRRRVEKKNICQPNNRNHSRNDEELVDYYDIDDFKVGNIVDIYSRNFHIVDCNESTKEYVTIHHGWTQEDITPIAYPRDSFTECYKAKMMLESGVPGVDRKRKMHDLTEVMESMLGKQLSTIDRGAFLKCGQDALCFYAIWDDTERLYGDIQHFRLIYYLADGTIEVLSIHKKNDGRYPFPKLLTRTKLPKPGDGSQFYTWQDLCIGSTIDIFGRTMQLARCDGFTRKFYESHGISLQEDMPMEKESEKIEVIQQIPPHNGFGSEEDSLRSCTGSINPPPVRRDFAKLKEKQGLVLRFNARLLVDETANRRFVIQFFMEDDTIAIHEPPIRNSGVMGGKFLSRQVVKKSDGNKYLAGDMYTGNILDIMCHHFELLNADDSAYRIMENDSKTFPFSCFKRVWTKLGPKKDDICRFFVTEYAGGNKINFEDLIIICKTLGVDLNKQEIQTLWRKVDKKRKGAVPFTKLINLLQNANESITEVV